MPKTDDVHAGISSEAVRAKTGKTWKEWFALLDKSGASDWPHKDIARHLHDECGCPGWWSQMITVGYEQARGLRVKHQKCDGEYSASASKTLAVPVSALFAAWYDPKLRSKWLADAKRLTIRKATENKSLRITWPDGTNVDVNLFAKGPAKSQVAVEHGKLARVGDVPRIKAYWTEALGKLQKLLED
ncbi:MAG TPA: hypothetical protein VL371_00645 [Gemmataceae bacterium]|jgi:hypothetical protein|nr:hypothetical protein [Gemmataceae bacterium]